MSYKDECAHALYRERKIYVEGYVGSWTAIDDRDGWVLLEHNQWGDETNLLLVYAPEFIWRVYVSKIGEKCYRPFFPHNSQIYETYDDIVTALEDFCLI